ncbi:hypothetical protein ACO0LM_23245 [Undibacterium sp. Di26W]|uniref:hypothetical protein n=1 Tax=Undibacterium sp. Di26W TaxID=3413035 RepID=UPI003BF28D17
MCKEKLFSLNVFLVYKKLFFIFPVLLVAIISVFLIWPFCNYSCRAHALYKNQVFFELRDFVAQNKTTSSALITTSKPFFSNDFIYANGIDYWDVSEVGTITVKSIGGKVTLIAKPVFTEKGMQWTCNFYPTPIEIYQCPSTDSGPH